MDSITRRYAAIEQAFVQWAETRDDIRVVIKMGSRTRVDRPADEWSDLDFSLFVDDPAALVNDTSWFEAFGKPWVTFVERGCERRVMYEGGLDVDFNFDPVEYIYGALEHGMSPDGVLAYGRGFRVVIDKIGIGDLRAMLPDTQPAPPAERAFLEVINDFLYHVVWTVKKLKRGELWTAKGCSDGYIKWNCLLPMIEWHARFTLGRDTWFRGRFLDDWADPRAAAALKDAFARYDADDITRGLLATLDLFRWLVVETAGALGYAYPHEADKQMVAWVGGVFRRAGV